MYFEIKPNRYITLNSLSGAMDVADDSVIEIIQRLRRGEDYRGDIEDYLIERGYAFATQEEETKLLQRLLYEWKRSVSESPLSFVVVPTYNCNFRCTYCFEADINRNTATMDEKTMSKMFETMDELASVSVKKPNVLLFGGEPLLEGKNHRNMISKILENCNQRGWPISDVVTNGWALQRYSAILEKYAVKQVQVTLDGPAHIHNKRRILANGDGTFDRIVAGIDDVLSRGIGVNLRVNVDDQNIECLPELAGFIIRKGWCEKMNFKSHLGLVYPHGCKDYLFCSSEIKILKSILALRKHFPQTKALGLAPWTMVNLVTNIIRFKEPTSPRFAFCGANTTTYCFDLHGKVYACIDGVGRDEFVVGKFIPRLEIDEEAMKKWRRTYLDIPKCKNCDVALLCGGGCNFHTLLSGRTLDDPICPDPKALLKAILQYFYPYLTYENEKHLEYDKFEFGYPQITSDGRRI
jgi:uncharacterized protein